MYVPNYPTHEFMIICLHLYLEAIVFLLFNECILLPLSSILGFFYSISVYIYIYFLLRNNEICFEIEIFTCPIANDWKHFSTRNATDLFSIN